MHFPIYIIRVTCTIKNKLWAVVVIGERIKKRFKVQKPSITFL